MQTERGEHVELIRFRVRLELVELLIQELNSYLVWISICSLNSFNRLIWNLIVVGSFLVKLESKLNHFVAWSTREFQLVLTETRTLYQTWSAVRFLCIEQFVQCTDMCVLAPRLFFQPRRVRCSMTKSRSMAKVSCSICFTLSSRSLQISPGLWKSDKNCSAQSRVLSINFGDMYEFFKVSKFIS